MATVVWSLLSILITPDRPPIPYFSISAIVSVMFQQQPHSCVTYVMTVLGPTPDLLLEVHLGSAFGILPLQQAELGSPLRNPVGGSLSCLIGSCHTALTVPLVQMAVARVLRPMMVKKALILKRETRSNQVLRRYHEQHHSVPLLFLVDCSAARAMISVAHIPATVVLMLIYIVYLSRQSVIKQVALFPFLENCAAFGNQKSPKYRFKRNVDRLHFHIRLNTASSSNLGKFRCDLLCS
jgi:hypothetical protein